MFFWESLIFFLSSISTILVIYYKVSTNISQIAIAILLVILILLSGRFLLVTSAKSQNKSLYLLFLFLSSSFVQLFINTTGGLLSPFLILLHISTLGISFLLNLRSAIVFLFFSVAVLVANILLSQNISSFLSNDPGSTILYAISLVVVIPIGQFLTYNYHLKDALFRILKEGIQTREKREESIMGGLNELVLVTDRNFLIQSFNEAVAKTLHLSKNEIANHSILEVLPLEDKSGQKISTQQLLIDAILVDKVARIIDNFYLHAKTKVIPESVIIQIRPITDSKGEVSQLIFIITDTADSYLQKHTNISQACVKRQMLVQSIRETILKSRFQDTALGVELLTKIDEDILTAFEIEDHSVKEVTGFQDIAWICQQAVSANQKFAESLGVLLKFVFPEEEAAESAMLRLLATDFPRQSLPVSDFTVLVDQHWFEIAIRKLLDIAILLANGEAKRWVNLAISLVGKSSVNITITSSSPLLFPKDQQDLFIEYYGDLGLKTNLRLGSGLEGFIAKTIFTQLNIPLDVKCFGSPPQLVFSLTLSKLPHSTE